MIASGQVGLNKPYRAPVYQTYLECIQGLYKQGILGFYKGNGCRIFHLFVFEYLRNNLIFTFDGESQVYQRSSFFKDYLAATTAAVICHPLHFAESRFVLQNRLPNFQSYKSSWTLLLSTMT